MNKNRGYLLWMPMRLAMNRDEFINHCKEKGLKPYEYGNGHMVGCKPDSCLFCKHCTDVFWDYTHGPYAIICDLQLFEERIDNNNKCSKFEEEEDGN